MQKSHRVPQSGKTLIGWAPAARGQPTAITSPSTKAAEAYIGKRIISASFWLGTFAPDENVGCIPAVPR
jgi:hypothetical protein